MKKIINNLRNWLIHKLGGVTLDERNDNSYDSYKNGHRSAFEMIQKYADSIYGLPADEWCKKMYDRIEYLKTTFEYMP